MFILGLKRTLKGCGYFQGKIGGFTLAVWSHLGSYLENRIRNLIILFFKLYKVGLRLEIQLVLKYYEPVNVGFH